MYRTVSFSEISVSFFVVVLKISRQVYVAVIKCELDSSMSEQGSAKGSSKKAIQRRKVESL